MVELTLNYTIMFEVSKFGDMEEITLNYTILFEVSRVVMDYSHKFWRWEK